VGEKGEKEDSWKREECRREQLYHRDTRTLGGRGGEKKGKRVMFHLPDLVLVGPVDGFYGEGREKKRGKKRRS